MKEECVKYSGRLSAYVDRELSYEEEGFVRFHLERCDSCSESVREIKRIKELISLKSFKKELPEQLKKRILALLKGLEKKQRTEIRQKRILGFRAERIYQAMAIAASLLIVVFLTVKNTNSSALRACLIQHQKCIEDGIHRTYQCQTSLAYTGKIEKSLNLKPAIPSYLPAGYKFAGGDACLLDGHNMAHMVLGNRENLISFFQSRKPLIGVTFLERGTVEKKTIKFGEKGNFNYGYWKQGGIYCLVVGDISHMEIRKIALSVPEV